MSKCVRGKIKGLCACSYSCALEHDCKVVIEKPDKFFSLLKESLEENKYLMQMLNKR